MKSLWLIAAAVATVCEAQSPLDAPGEKKVTVRSEIARGYHEISFARTQPRDVYLAYLEGDLAKVIQNNESRQKDSDGFMLGARLGEVQQIDILLHLDGVERFNSQEDVATTRKDCREFVADIRKLEKQLGVDDDAVISAIGATEPELFSRTKALLASYEAAR